MPSSRARPRLDIRLLGPPEIQVDGRPLEVDTRKAVAILALLAAEGRPFARDELAALLWPDADDLAARGALRRTLSTMRSAVGDGPLLIDRARVALEPSQVVVDLALVDAAATATDRATLERAAAAARGTFLAGFHLRDSPEFDDWRATRAVAAERAILVVLDRLAAAAETDGDLATAVSAASRRLDIDPLDEAGHVRLMDLLVASGDRSGALRQYRACVAILDRELGVAPLASTTARYEAIRDGLGEATIVPAGDDAVPATAFTTAAASWPIVGRTDALATVIAAHDAVARDGGRVVTITGEAGIGKTRLAAESIVRWQAAGATVLGATAYPAERGIAYAPIVDLLRAALERPDAADRVARLDPATRVELARLLPAIAPDAVIEAVPAIALGDGPGARARLVVAIADGLAALVGPVPGSPSPGVLWLDDVQWLDAASLEVLEFLIRRPDRYRILVLWTWRPDDLDAETEAVTRRIADRPSTTTVTLDRLTRADVASLVAAAPIGTSPAEDAEDLIDRLVAASEGLPLYIVEVLADLPRASPETLPSGVRAVLRERLAALDEMSAQVVAAASVIGRSFDVATLRHAGGRSDAETVDAIDVAQARGIVRDAGAGYDFAHAALRDLAYEELSLARRRLLHHRVAEALRLDLGRSGRDDLGRLTLIAAHERSAGRDAEAAAAYHEAGTRAAELYANRAAIEQFEAALALGDPAPVVLHVAIGRLRTRLGDYAGAITAFEAAAARAGGDDLATIEWSLALAHLRRGDLAAAAFHLEAALARTPDDRLRARILVDRAVVERRQGDLATATRSATDALAAAEAAGDDLAAGAAWRLLGLTALDAGDLASAVTDLRRAVDAADQDPDLTARIAARVGLALAIAAGGEVDEALDVGESAAALARQIGDRHLEAAVEDHLADLLHAAGRDDEARPHQRAAVAAFAEVGGDRTDPDPGIWMLSAS